MKPEDNTSLDADNPNAAAYTGAIDDPALRSPVAPVESYTRAHVARPNLFGFNRIAAIVTGTAQVFILIVAFLVSASIPLIAPRNLQAKPTTTPLEASR